MAREIADPISTAIAVPSRRRRSPGEEQKPDKRPKPTAHPGSAVGDVSGDSPAPPLMTESFGEAILAAQLHPAPMSIQEHQLRVAAGWSPPASNLRLRDRTV